MQATVANYQARAGISERLMILRFEKARSFDHFGRNFEDISARDGMLECGAQGDAAPETHDCHSMRPGMQQQRYVGEETLCEHVRHVRRVNLSIDRKRSRAKRLAYRNRSRGPLAIVEEATGGEPGLQIGLTELGCGLVDPTR